MEITPISLGYSQTIRINTNRNVIKHFWSDDTKKTNIFDVLTELGKALYTTNGGEEVISSYGYNKTYLQYPNPKLLELSNSITEGAMNNDEKAEKIINWVLSNFPYKTDLENYGHDELWVPPLFALRKGSGDCEDGAFLVHSLLLHARIPYQNIRTYGGFVDAGEGAASGGHAWTAYRRETDNQWVVLDTSYFPNRLPVSERILMKDDMKYVDNYFYINMLEWHNTYAVDKIRNPGIYDQWGKEESYKSMGINIYA